MTAIHFLLQDNTSSIHQGHEKFPMEILTNIISTIIDPLLWNTKPWPVLLLSVPFSHPYLETPSLKSPFNHPLLSIGEHQCGRTKGQHPPSVRCSEIVLAREFNSSVLVSRLHQLSPQEGMDGNLAYRASLLTVARNPMDEGSVGIVLPGWAHAATSDV